MGSSPYSDKTPILGYEPIHRVAQSYLGSLWIAVRKDEPALADPVLLRHIQLPEDAPTAARDLVVRAGREATEVRHANVVTVNEVLEAEGRVAMVYEHVEAEPLRSLQSWANLRGVSFPVGVSLRIVRDLLSGVEAIHQRFGSSALPVFGGLSPDSVLVSREGHTRLCDPLIASCSVLLEAVGCSTAKLSYAAPEQVNAAAPLTPQCDLFTCGAMLWELVATRRFLSGSRTAIERKLLEHNLPKLTTNLRGDQRVAPELVALVERMLAAEIPARGKSALSLADELGRCGHEIATHQEVAEFIGKLSGPRFDRRTAAIRSKSLPALEVPAQLPVELPTRPGASRRGAPLLKPRAGADASAAQGPALEEGSARQPLPVPTPPRAGAASAPGGAAGGPRHPFPTADARAAMETPAASADEMEPVTASFPMPPLTPRRAAATGATPRTPPGATPRTATRAHPTARGGTLMAPVPPPAPAPPSGLKSTWIAAVPPAPEAAPLTPAAAPAPPARAPAFVGPPALAEPMPPTPALGATTPGGWNPAPPPLSSAPGPSAASPPRGRTMTGLGQPAAAPPVHPALRPSLPFANLTPAPFPAGHAPPNAPAALPAGAQRAAGPDAALPSTLRTADPPLASAGGEAAPAWAPHAGPSAFFPTPPGPGEPTPSTRRGSANWARALIPARAAHRLAWVALFLLTFGVSSVVFVVFLARSPGSRGDAGPEAAALAEAEAEAAATAEGRRQPAATAQGTPATHPAEADVGKRPAAQAAGEAVGSTKDSKAEGSAPAAASANAPKPSAEAIEGRFDAPTLEDSELLALFALEARQAQPSCSERLGPSSGQYTGKNPAESNAQLRAAQRELMRGKLESAHTFLCGATAHDPSNVAAQQALSELSLQLGDAERAKAAAQRALETKPDDAALRALLADALALLGQLDASRRLWLESLPGGGSAEERSRRLASSFRVLGDRALRSSGFARARNYYRRAIVLSAGSYAPTVGFTDALLWLGHRRAALAWAARAARAFPKDSHIQLLYGDALYDNERPDRARAAWQAALDAHPGNGAAARRLREGRR